MTSTATLTDIAAPAGEYAALNASLRSAVLGASTQLRQREAYPIAAPALTSTVYASGTSPSALAAGNDTTGTGLIAAPYASASKIQAVVTSGAGDAWALLDGGFPENTGANGRLVLAGAYTRPLVFDSYSGLAANFSITNVSGANGVISVRGSPVDNVHFRHATIRSATEGNPLFRHDPTNSSNVGKRIKFFDSVLEAKTHSAVTAAIVLNSDYGAESLHLVRCAFKRVAGSSTTSNPSIISTTAQAQSIGNQPHKDIGLWGCYTTDAQWSSFSTGLTGVAKFTAAYCEISTSLNHAMLIGTDTSDPATPQCTDVLAIRNKLNAFGANGHGLEFGANVVGGRSISNEIFSELQGIVFKGANAPLSEADVVTIRPRATFGSAFYSKASVGAKFRNGAAFIDGTVLSVNGFREGADSAVKASNTELTGMVIECLGPNAAALQWGDSTASTGGATSDYNTYILRAGATLGYVRGHAVTSLAELQAAWALYGLAGDNPLNDANSTVIVLAA